MNFSWTKGIKLLYGNVVKKLLFLVLLALPIVWCIREPETAKNITARALRFVEARAGDFANRLSPPEGGGAGVSEEGRGVIDKATFALPPNEFLLRESTAAKPQPLPGMIKKGARVRAIGEGNGRKLITDGTREAMVDDSLLTRDPTEIEALMSEGKVIQEAQSLRRKTELEASLGQIETKLTSVQNELKAVRERDAIAREEGKKSSQFGTQEAFLLTEIRRQEGFREAILKELQALR
ncbi:hypothetical protein FEM03_20205 [Phragmitibacter flavus]|uniref:Uncharacterized protein n=1 Tax=Phragmitibacter flavus TaxID=2576071 RepID=A0A5R8K9I9_9BACT|nr:hypothetical protein [Phragmitibacter flavus]TLD68986.1 hypothetical protein FEM03_20205 [Phragmitibacter flavus]